MRYNNSNKKQHENEIQYSNQFQISPRYDLLDEFKKKDFGATDAKITNIEQGLLMST